MNNAFIYNSNCHNENYVQVCNKSNFMLTIETLKFWSNKCYYEIRLCEHFSLYYVYKNCPKFTKKSKYYGCSGKLAIFEIKGQRSFEICILYFRKSLDFWHKIFQNFRKSFFHPFLFAKTKVIFILYYDDVSSSKKRRRKIWQNKCQIVSDSFCFFGIQSA